MSDVDDLARQVGIVYFDYQVAAFEAGLAQQGPKRMCLFYKTGAGKTITGLSLMRLWHEAEVLVVAPPSTRAAWEDWGQRLNMQVEVISHAKFRMKDYKLSRNRAVIVDEFHLLGGHQGQGWKKLDRLAQSLLAPLVIMSATPNYNDAERVYCIQHVLDPHSCKGGYLEFLYAHCETEQSMFSRTPDVTGFKHFADAAEYLAALPHVQYLADDLVYAVVDHVLPEHVMPELDCYGYNVRDHRMVASGMEERHTRAYQGLVDERGHIRPHVLSELVRLVDSMPGPVLVYANHATVAEAVYVSLRYEGRKGAVVTGKTSAKAKDLRLDAFRSGSLDILVGTASLGTGTDGLDKVCDMLVILDDTDDDAARRQLIGRIMPRGEGGDATVKQVHRLVLP